ncbi:cobalamin biosynthesis protein CbiM [Caloranaerobacter azorensis H53214]|uniref:Cobalt transport protein CbiM n=1 Tax=Caloranaerobacter azorensis H53214 TaxID=1156417 RepID=A0A096DKY4_9FIRM|nr:energy-coupling factor ABC transporter permease [Caloranaerobacter azorensis]KGG79951.1 cobalamin biosynthesis protein CbiM [Caloranaerobacter azorensis H53214]
MKNKKIFLFLSIYFLYFLIPNNVYAMHIMEGFLPVKWTIIWFIISIPFILIGIRRMNRICKDDINMKMLLGLCGAFVFVLSSLKIPSVTGSCSHPTGVGLGAILFGPMIASVLALIVLIFQALLLAHGGITTLGANVFSMGIAGPIAAYGIYKLFSKGKKSKSLSIFLAAAIGDLVTYIVTSIQLGVAFPSEIGGVIASVTKFLGIFAVTQIPLAISEGLLTVIVYNLLTQYNKDELQQLAARKLQN